MKSRYANILMLLGAILAFVPIMAVDYLLDAYVRVREQGAIQNYVQAVAAQVQTSVADTMQSMQAVLAATPSLCTPTFTASVQQMLESSLSLKQVLIENSDGVQYCDALGRKVDYSPISESLPIPGHAESLSVVRLANLAVPALKVTQPYGSTRLVSAFLPLIGQSKETMASALPGTAMMRILLTNGTPILTVGDPTIFDKRSNSADFIQAQAFAGELPLKVEMALPFAVGRANYADLDVSLTIVAALMSGAFLILALQYARRSRVPAFDLERAIARGEIKPYYQPVINLRTGELAGCEVLCRWEKKNGQIVMPGAFIDYAETTGLAIPMTLSLMQQVKFDLADICQLMPSLKISINLFEGHFRDASIVEDVQAIFGGSQIGLRQLVFEITERHPLANSVVATSVIAGLHALGCKLALDDAGTGHSNLAYLGTLGCDVIKIDRVFIDMIKPGTTQVPVLDGLIAMAQDLNCEIVAEGVETEAQALYLRARGVVQAQGFIFSPALKVNAYKELARALHATRGARSAAGSEVADAA